MTLEDQNKTMHQLLWIFLLCGYTYAENRTDAENVASVLFNSYDPAIRPIFGQRLNVTVGFFLFSIKDFDEKSGTLTSVGGPFYMWNDPRLTWNPLDNGNLYTFPITASKLWYPNLYLINPANKMEPIGDESFVLRMSYNGDVWRYMGSIIKTTCDIDMTYFPFDTQECQIDMSAWGFLASEIFLTPLQSDVDLTYYNENSQWKVVKSELKEYQLKGIDGMVTVKFSLKRKPEYFAINILAPIFMLCLLNPLVFFLPMESGERISYTITIFLSLAVFMTLISDNMPQSSDPMARLSYVLLATMGYSTILCIVTIFIMGVHFKDKSKPIPKWMCRLVFILKCGCICCCRNRKTEQNTTNVIPIKEKTKKGFVTDEKPKTKTGFVVDENDSVDDFTEEMTWKDLAQKFDMIFFVYSVVFLVLLIILTFVFLLV